MCQSKVTHGLVQPFERLYNGSWVFAALNAQVTFLNYFPETKNPIDNFFFNDLPDETDAMRQAAESTKYKLTASIAPLLSLLITGLATNSFFC